jgi:hypothetical protein
MADRELQKQLLSKAEFYEEHIATYLPVLIFGVLFASVHSDKKASFALNLLEVAAWALLFLAGLASLARLWLRAYLPKSLLRYEERMSGHQWEYEASGHSAKVASDLAIEGEKQWAREAKLIRAETLLLYGATAIFAVGVILHLIVQAAILLGPG